MARWVVTGGAGYIGAHVVSSLRSANHDVTVVDDLSTGNQGRLFGDVETVIASVLDTDQLALLFRRIGPDGVIHVAGKKSPTESVDKPLWYHRENVGGVESVLTAMLSVGTSRLVFSSSCSVYGTPDQELVDESAPPRPESPYGQSKAAGERLIEDAAHAYGIDYATLRYFNVVGAADAQRADFGEYNLVPLVFRALREGRQPLVFGDDYPTPDGSCVRDYVHVVDVADAHVRCAQALMEGSVRTTLNVGTGTGSSVFEILDVIGRCTGRDTSPRVVGRRAGDPARVVGDVSRMAAEMGWKASRGVEEMISSAWLAVQDR